ncbi:protein SIEVE ELEMENT OCCLUSION C [Tripterygium wilfordii]|uniref:protein SIEVE ELEMENT OCCLUSION C n=1 Tax=Tripterygium wilfordii TaxID=458696 RepID=UPI0018F8277B|nr:protein SIEVE ELEMENT OCCLUSION C [Tripterygium wilfordii]
MHSSLSLDEDILVRKLLLTHDPDGRHLDSELLLQAVEKIICYATPSGSLVSDLHLDGMARNDINNIEVIGSQELLGHAIYEISRQMLYKCSGEGSLHARAMILFDLLGNYRWDAKVVIVLAAFATIYGEFWLQMQLNPRNTLAALVAMLKQLPGDLSMEKPRFKALSLLTKNMLEVTKCIIKFEVLPFAHLGLGNEEAIATTKSRIYIASYWVTRSALACSSQFLDLIALKPEYSHSTIIAAWELSSLSYRLSSIHSLLWRLVDLFYQDIEKKIYEKLLNLFKETHNDNQEVLCTLLAIRDDLSLKDCSTQGKVDVSELRNKVVILLISKSELLPFEELVLLVRQTYDHPHHQKLEGSYGIVWIPMSNSNTWTAADKETFHFLSNLLPWYSLWQPWLLNHAVVNYIKEAWNYNTQPLMVVLDSKGTVTNSNAIDMVLIWGAKAYPFSTSREAELWQEENWTLQLLTYQIDPLLSKWVDEGRNICIYGSENLDWIKEFHAKILLIKSSRVQLEMVFVGKRNLSENVKSILDIIRVGKHKSLFSFTTIYLFWLRLECMRRSKQQSGKTSKTDNILENMSALLEVDDEAVGWAVIGRGSSADVVRLHGEKLMETLNSFPEWAENVGKLGFLGALRTAIEPPPPLPGPCNHVSVVPFDKGLIEGTVLCEKCKRPMKISVVYE